MPRLTCLSDEVAKASSLYFCIATQLIVVIPERRTGTLNQKRHPLHEDALAFASTMVLVTLGVEMLSKVGLITGGLAGFALLLAKLTPFGFGPLFAVLNLPFYVLAFKELGARFTVNTIICVLLVSVFSEYIGHFIEIQAIDPAFAAIAGGVLIGFGMLIVFRHQASLGGIGILTYYLQNRFGWRAGYVQLGMDLGILSIGFFTLDISTLLMSVLAAVVLNSVLAINHKPGRYNIA